MWLNVSSGTLVLFAQLGDPFCLIKSLALMGGINFGDGLFVLSVSVVVITVFLPGSRKKSSRLFKFADFSMSMAAFIILVLYRLSDAITRFFEVDKVCCGADVLN